MNYFIDFEFLEGDIPQKICGFTIPRWLSKPHNTIQPISLGIISEDNREYYAISKDFNLKEAWNRYDLKLHSGDRRNIGDGTYKEYWIRENVLKQIWRELIFKADECWGMSNKQTEVYYKEILTGAYDHHFTFKSLKALIEKYGKTNKEIAEEIKDFCKLKVTKYGTLISSAEYPGGFAGTSDENLIFDKEKALIEVRKSDEEERNRNVPMFRVSLLKKEFDVKPKFYAYYADYDWVAFCWLFGKMIDLPKGFPMYCIDLKQELDRKLNSIEMYEARDCFSNDPERWLKGDLQKDDRLATLEEKLKAIKHREHLNYPKQENEHSAICDARWNKKLHEFLNQL